MGKKLLPGFGHLVTGAIDENHCPSENDWRKPSVEE